MTTLKFMTNINCGNCVRSVTGFLNDVEGIESWEVDTTVSEKWLTVKGQVAAEAVIEAVEDAGFEIKTA